MNELVEWLSHKTNVSLSSFGDPKMSRQVCYFLVNLTGRLQMAPKISVGKNPYERSSNYQLAKSIFASELNLPFNYSIAKLVQGDEEEVQRLLEELKSLSEPFEEDGEISLNDLLDQLGNDLAEKLSALKSSRREMDDIAEERNFYLNKLERVVEVASEYPKEDVEVILNIVRVPPADFLPRND